MIGGNRVDYWRDTLIKRAFITGTSQTAVAAQNSHIQLWNPAASGKLLIVEKIGFKIQTAGTVYLAYYATTLATLAASQGNKYLGEADGVGLIKRATNAGALGTTISRLYYVTEQEFVFERPIIIGEEMGLVILNLTVDEYLKAYFEWIEV